MGYADDIFLLSPTLDGLQDMIDTCHDFAVKHNLTFSTDPVPRKCKTKCLAFLKNHRSLRKLKLGNNELPWVDTAKHLGNKITTLKDGMTQDIFEKRASYISRNNELQQEFNFAHPKTLVKVNNIYNSHFYGSNLWDLFSKEVDMIAKSWNVSQRIMNGLDRKTHKYLIEPVSKTQHIMFHLQKRFITFTESIMTSNKLALRKLFDTVKYDCQSTTGRNLRMLMLRYERNNIRDINTKMLTNYEYAKIPDEENWRINLIKELIDVRHGIKSLPHCNRDEVKCLLDFTCIS